MADPLLDLAERQDGLLTRVQALELGLTSRQFGRRLHGRWQPVLPGVVATFTGHLTVRQHRRAALLYASPRTSTFREVPAVVLGGATAAQQHGLRAAVPSPAVEVLVPAVRHVRSSGFVRVRHTRRAEVPHQVDGLPVYSVARSVADASREMRRLPDVRALVAESVQRGMTTVDRLHAELVAGERRGSRLLAVALREVAAGVRSAPEAQLREIVRSTGLPEPGWNVDVTVSGVRIARADAVWAHIRLVLEVDSREWHLNPADWQATMRRHNRLAAAGYLVLHFPPSRLGADRAGVAAEIVATYLRLGVVAAV